MRHRNERVAHPFGTSKRTLDQGSLLRRGQPNVRAAMRLTVLADTMKRVITIVGVSARIAAGLAPGTGALAAKIVGACILVSIITIIWRWIQTTARDFSHRLALQWTEGRAYFGSSASGARPSATRSCPTSRSWGQAPVSRRDRCPGISAGS